MCKTSENIKFHIDPVVKIGSINNYLPAENSGGKSDIYNTGLLVHFDNSVLKGSDTEKQAFISSYYKIYNIELARNLDQCAYRNNKIIRSHIKGLSCCSHVSKIQVWNGSETRSPVAKNIGTTDKCRRSTCPRCSSIRSSKYKRRFKEAYESEEYKELFDGKYFYHIILTLKHNTIDTRTDVYLNQLKEYVHKLRRSKLWKEHFYYSSDQPDSGYIQNYELTLGDNGYHIHSHILMCSPRLIGKVSNIQAEFRKKWFEITGDSTGFELNLVRFQDKKGIEQGSGKLIDSVLSELFKYTVKSAVHKELNDSSIIEYKTGSLKDLELSRTDLLANWLILTARKKMLTANGFLKGMELFLTGDSKLDDDFEKDPVDNPKDNYTYYAVKTAQIKFNYSLVRGYSKSARKNMLNNVYLKSLPENAVDITHVVDEFDKYWKCAIDENTANFLNAWVQWCESESKEKLSYEHKAPIDQVWINSLNTLPKELEFIQLKLFNDV